MQRRRPADAAVTTPGQGSAVLRMGAALPLAGAALIWALAAWPGIAQDDGVTETYGVSTFGELRYGPDAAHLDYVNPDAPQGGEMSFAWSSGSFDSLHPYTRIGRPAVLSSVFFESMLEGTADEIGSSYCLLCESMAFPEDRSYVIFTIREEARFSDGTPVTADDALFSYEILRDEGLPSFRATLPLTIASAEVLDERRIRFDFNPDAPVRGRIEAAGGLPIFSRASHEASGLDFEDSRLEPLVGSGPYVLGEVDPGQRVVYARNRDYWGEDLWINQGRHNYDSIRIEYYGDAIAAFEGFTAGNYTFRQESSSQAWANNYDFPKLDQGIVLREELPDGTIASGQSFMINLRRPQFQDVRVREAIALMFNFEWTNQTLFYGLYSHIDSFWENTHLEASGLPSDEELAVLEPLRDLLPERVFAEEAFATPPSNPDRTLDRRQARRATALLEEAGWVPGDDGLLRNAAGETLDVEFLNSGPLFDRIINPYVENLRAIGVNARLNRVDNAQLSQRQRDGDFDIVTDHFPMDYEPGSGLRQYFGSIGADESLFNVPGLADDGVDALVEVVVNAETQDEMEVAVRALDRVLRAHVIRVPQWYNNQHWVAYYDMYRYPEELPPYSLGFLDFWWIDPEAEADLRAQGAF
ncbi:extracellular solute-binding protein [Maritalea mobilis]|uniref:extracellular solute-binding protein n=1 Tax=Maritalea mobilis TaxID=483324 RepID=UPI001C9389AD|nr:extracellular solute-binding protein [Maritalea mobilis]MBY6202662.1 extracellular solute-binding protein [Maritalea mobilis]